MNQARVFISYSRKNLAQAEDVRNALNKAGFVAFLDKEDISPGEPWRNRLANLIRETDKVVMLVSPAAMTSEFCRWEIDQAERIGRPIFPALIEDVELQEVPGRLARLNFIFLRSPDERAANLPRLVDALGTDVHWERERSRINELAERWEKNTRNPRDLIQSRGAIEAAENWRDMRPEASPPPSDLQAAFISASRKRQVNGQRRLLSAGLVVSTLLAVAAIVTFLQRNAAMENERVAIVERERANAERDQTLLTESRFLAGLADERNEEGDTTRAMAVALRGLPKSIEDPDRPIEATAMRALQDARWDRREIRSMGSPDQRILHAGFAGNTLMVVEEAGPGTYRVWNADSEAETARMRTEIANPRVDVSSDFRTLVFSSKDAMEVHWLDPQGQIVRMDLPNADFRAEFVDANDRFVFAADGGAHVFDLASAGIQATVPEGAEAFVFAMSANGQYFAFADGLESDARICRVDLLDQRTNDHVFCVRNEQGGSLNLGFGANDQFLYSAGFDSFDVRQAKDLRLVQSRPDHDNPSTIFVGSRQGNLLAQYHEKSRELKLGSIQHPNQTMTLNGHQGRINHLSFSQNEELLVTGGFDGTVRLWDSASGSEILKLHHGEVVIDVEISADGKRLIALGSDAILRVWSLLPVEYREIALPVAGPIRAMAATEDDSLLAVTIGATVYVLDRKGGQWQQLFGPHASWPSELTFTKEARPRLVMSGLQFTWLIDPMTGEITFSRSGVPNSMGCAAMHPDQKTLAICNLGAVEIWDTERNRLRAALHGHRAKITQLRFSPDGSHLLSGAADNELRLWDVALGETLTRYVGHNSWIRGLAFGPDPDKFVSSANDSTIRFWNVGQNVPDIIAYGSEAGVGVLSYNRDGSKVISGDNAGDIQIRNASTGAILNTFSGHASVIVGIQHLSDGRSFLSADRQRILFWQTWPQDTAFLQETAQLVEGLNVLTQAELCIYRLVPEESCSRPD